MGLHRANPRVAAALLGLAICTASAAQSGRAPVPLSTPAVVYPPIAKAAHVVGTVVVEFSIDSDGATTGIQTLSGPPMLRPAVEDKVRQWRFKVPLPIGARDTFDASYTFTMDDPQNEDSPDDLGGPPRTLCCNDLIVGGDRITALVRTPDGSQSIDVTPPPPPPVIPCPDEKDKTPPTTTSPTDFVELYRTACSDDSCATYRVRINRSGAVEWQGGEGVSLSGFAASRVNPAEAAHLLDRLQISSLWLQCSYPIPSADEYLHADGSGRTDILTLSIGSHTKTIDSTNWFSGKDRGPKFSWAIDTLADTHQWRHTDAGKEPFTNMRDDLLLPKPGITALMRSLLYFTSSNEYPALKLLLAYGSDPNASDESGWTALMYAVELNQDDRAVRLLLDAHANVNQASRHGDTALMIDAYSAKLDHLLLSAGAEINAQNADGVTPLMLLSQYGLLQQLKDAVAAGANVAIKDNAGRTALDYLRAASCGKPIIPLPHHPMQATNTDLPPCPSTTSTFLEDEAFLASAMAKKSAR